jgi:VWFA-related protein
MLTRYKRQVLALSLLAAAVALVGQSLDPSEARFSAAAYLPKPAVTIQAESRLVEIGVVVRDSRGHSVSGLTQADFDVRDEGKRREIKGFSVQKFAPAGATAAPDSAAQEAAPGNQPKPRWVAMVFDNLSMPAADLYNSKAAAKRYLKDGLAANDRVAVLTISSGQVLPFTSDAAKIAEAIDKVKLQERQIKSSTCPLLTPYDAYQIANGIDPTALTVKAAEYSACASACGITTPPRRTKGGGGNGPPPCDAAIQGVQAMSRSLWEEIRLNSQATLLSLKSIVDFMTRLNGSRVILMASSGFLSGTLEYEESQLVDRALHGNVVINALDAKGLYTSEGLETGQATSPQSVIYRQLQGTRGKAALNDAMGDLAESTGGLYFHNNNDLNAGFKELGMQPEVSYLLAVEPAALDNKYHPLKVSLTGANRGSVQARKGYLAAADKTGKPENAPADRRMDQEVFTTTSLDEAPVTVAVSSEKSAEGHTTAELTFHVNIAKARFTEQAGVRVQTFHMIAALFDAEGTYVNGTEAQLEFALKEPTYQRLLPAGFNAKISLDVAPGNYRLRSVMVEGGENGRYSTATTAAGIH